MTGGRAYLYDPSGRHMAALRRAQRRRRPARDGRSPSAPTARPRHRAHPPARGPPRRPARALAGRLLDEADLAARFWLVEPIVGRAASVDGRRSADQPGVHRRPETVPVRAVRTRPPVVATARRSARGSRRGGRDASDVVESCHGTADVPHRRDRQLRLGQRAVGAVRCRLTPRDRGRGPSGPRFRGAARPRRRSAHRARGSRRGFATAERD